MHLIVLENEPSSFRGGQELSLLDVCRGLYKRGHRITLLYVKEGDLLTSYREFSHQVIKVHGYRINRQGIINSIGYFLADIGKIETSKTTVVYSNQYHDSFWSYSLALAKNIPFVCHLRLPPPPNLGFQWSLGMRGAKQLIAVSQQTKLDWVNKGFKSDKITVVYNGINPDKFHPSPQVSVIKKQWGINEDIKLISYIGRLDKDKGVETLIKGFALLLKSGIKAKLLIAGKPLCQNHKYQQDLEKIVEDLGIENDTTFLGHIINIVPLYQVSDLTVLPSLNSEPFGRTIIESMACGTPVAASRIGGIVEILTDEFANGLFEPGNAQDLSNTLIDLLKLKEQEPQMSAKCREHVLSKFNLNRMVDGVEQVMLNVVQ